ncbi:hypothetical protein [Dermacoccus nishinomiyaensis]|uniref:hypothetical protein n=1 Tax=Dermacoccus nishinomiyaensis TaxID=1274 RepID=UPI00119CC094|nr:hypothetical protein [Dermacoccus nishinomiyaensis]
MRRSIIITLAVAVLGIIGAVSAFALSSRIGAPGGHGGSEPAQPDRAIARDIENAVRHQPGVANSRVVMKVNCIDGCQGRDQEFTVDVTLTDDASARHVLDVNRTINELYPRTAPPEWARSPGRIRFSLHSPLDGALIVPTSNGSHGTASSPTRASALTSTQVDAFVAAARVNPSSSASWSSSGRDDAPSFVVRSTIKTSDCATLDATAANTVTALSAIRRKGTPAEFHFRCEHAAGEVPIGATTHTTGWSTMTDTLSRLMTPPAGSRSYRRDGVYLKHKHHSAVLTVTGHPSNATSEVKNDATTVVAQLRALEVPTPTLDLRPAP